MATRVVVEFNQNSFANGLNYLSDTTRIGPGQYPLLINGRTRFDTVDYIQKHLDVTDSIFSSLGSFQACYSAGNILVVFCGGRGFYKNMAVVGSGWTPIVMQGSSVALQMNASVDRIYLESIPASTINYKRLPATDEASSDVALTNKIAASPVAILCQDGISQPVLIQADGSARVTNNWEQWTVDNREYVPIGTLMKYYDGILYIVSGSQILRSCTGRPLDYMIVLDSNGQKVNPAAASDAFAVSHSIDNDDITALFIVNSNVKALGVGSLRNTNLITTDRAVTLFAEPTFKNQFICSTGPINDVCITDILGDSAFVTFKGIRSFNAVLQDRNEGKNMPFSQSVFRLFQGIIQTSAAAINYDDYAIFDMDSVYGRIWLIYDTIKAQFVGWDQSSVSGADEAVKQFAVVKTVASDRLFFITNGKLFEAYSDTTEVETTQVYIGDVTSGNPKIELKSLDAKCVFIDAKETGTITAKIYSDGKLNATVPQTLQQNNTVDTLPLTIPFGYGDEDTVKNITFSTPDSLVGWKGGVLLSWDFRAKLSNVNLSFNTQPFNNAAETAATDALLYATAPSIISMTPTSGIATTIVALVGTRMLGITQVYIGDTECAIIVQDDVQCQFVIPPGATNGNITLVTPGGEIEYAPFTVT